MSVCSDMLEVILGPINIQQSSTSGTSKPSTSVAAVGSETEETTDSKIEENLQSDVAIACNAMSCSIVDNKDSSSADTDTKTEEPANDKGIKFIKFLANLEKCKSLWLLLKQKIKINEKTKGVSNNNYISGYSVCIERVPLLTDFKACRMH